MLWDFFSQTVLDSNGSRVCNHCKLCSTWESRPRDSGLIREIQTGSVDKGEVEESRRLERVARAETCTSWARAAGRVGAFPIESGHRIQVAPPRGRHVRSLHPFLRQLNKKTRSRLLLTSRLRTTGTLSIRSTLDTPMMNRQSQPNRPLS